MRFLLLMVTAACLGGCVQTIASTAVDIVTLPVKVASRTVDLATTSQSEADAKRGREMRRQDEERGRLFREAQERCRAGKPTATDDCTAGVPR